MLTILYLALATSALSVTLAKTKITQPFRDWVFSRSAMLGKLLSCSYCLSHYVAFTLVIAVDVRPLAISVYFNWFITTFIVVAIAAVVSGAVMRLLWMHETEVAELRDLIKELR